jgi:inosose dehydratase
MLKIGNAPCSWGVLEFDLDGGSVGYAQMLDEMQGTGYQGTDLGDWGFMPTEPQVLRGALEARKLELVSAFVPVALADESAHQGGIEAAVRTAKLLAAAGGSDDPFIVLADNNGKDPIRTQNAGRITPGQGLSDAQWETFARGAESVARAVREETGLRTVFHHHCAGYIETPQEVSRLMMLADPALIGLCFDTGHYRFGGGDPVAGLKELIDRVWLVHFKDCDPVIAQQSRSEEWDYFQSVRAGVFCELGKGDVNFPVIAGLLGKHHYDSWIVVEQDVLPGMGTPAESAQRNRDYLAKIGL